MRNTLSRHLTAGNEHDHLPHRADCPMCVARQAGPELRSDPITARGVSTALAITLTSAALAPAAASAAPLNLKAPEPASKGLSVVKPPTGPSDDVDAPSASADEGRDATRAPEASAEIPDRPAPPVKSADVAPTVTDAPPEPPKAAAPEPAAPEVTSTPKVAEAPSAPAPARTPAAPKAPEARSQDLNLEDLELDQADNAPTPKSTPSDHQASHGKPSGPASTSSARAAASPSDDKRSSSSSSSREASESTRDAATAPKSDKSDKSATGASSSHVVTVGESLWAIARAQLGSDASIQELAGYVNDLWNANASAIASGDPDVIEIGQRLTLPEGP